ncbi:Short-chain dehydrogenase/reductase SDR [Dillenia turbinata]|uniref:Short-chain dehydrogenase/reductase SDR n=1 Tax=Dillenia turbinata TaxID=194707 RepID=A0AAN8W3Q5_9MAGN
MDSRKKEALGWMDWGRGWMCLVYEMLFQRINARHLQNPMPLPPLHSFTFVITGSTSGIGLQIARQLAESGGHVVMAVRNPKAAHELIQKWQNEWSGKGLPLNIEVMELDLLSLESVVRFAEEYNARLASLHALINNAGIFSIGGGKFQEEGLRKIEGSQSLSIDEAMPKEYLLHEDIFTIKKLVNLSLTYRSAFLSDANVTVELF